MANDSSDLALLTKRTWRPMTSHSISGAGRFHVIKATTTWIRLGDDGQWEHRVDPTLTYIVDHWLGVVQPDSQPYLDAAGPTAHL